MAKNKGGQNVNPVESAVAAVGAVGEQSGGSEGASLDSELGLDGAPVEGGVEDFKADAEPVAAVAAVGVVGVVGVRSLEVLKNVALSAMTVEEIAAVDAAAGDPEAEKQATAGKVEAIERTINDLLRDMSKRAAELKDDLYARMPEWQARLQVRHECAVELARRVKEGEQALVNAGKAEKDAELAKLIQAEQLAAVAKVRRGGADLAG